MYLKHAGMIQSPQRGVVEISDQGRQLLAEAPARIDTGYLKGRSAVLRAWLTTTREDAPATSVVNTTTPDEQMEDIYRELMEQVADDLLDTLKACSPYFFEKVVIQLLRAMGYGGISGRGLVTPRSRDGGIDGVIYEDKLGLDNVCVQAKRWEGTVGRTTVQAFVGSMDLHRSRKGVIITTSTFSNDAQEFVSRIEGKKVVLIAGEELTHLMVEHRVGVIQTRSYELVDVSQDFFDEET